MLIDVHAHLDFEQFDSDREDILEEAREAGIIVITSGVGPESIEKTMGFIDKYENVFTTLGTIPEEVNSETVEKTIALIRKYRDKIVGIGEVGLEYYWVKEEEKREKERENFRKFINLAKELSLPLVVHSRDAEGDVLGILRKEGVAALLHCFSGSLEEANLAVSFGCLISIPTSVVYSKQKRKLAKGLPLDNIVLETDAPFLAPVPKTRNLPINVRLSAEKISKIRGITLEEVRERTTRNAIDFFNLKF